MYNKQKVSGVFLKNHLTVTANFDCKLSSDYKLIIKRQIKLLETLGT